MRAMLALGGKPGHSDGGRGRAERCKTEARMAELGCRFGQGFHYSEPVPHARKWAGLLREFSAGGRRRSGGRRCCFEWRFRTASKAFFSREKEELLAELGMASRLACVCEHRSGVASCGHEHRRAANVRQTAARASFASSSEAKSFCLAVAVLSFTARQRSQKFFASFSQKRRPCLLTARAQPLT